jgi:hypothetical protein
VRTWRKAWNCQLRKVHMLFDYGDEFMKEPSIG